MVKELSSGLPKIHPDSGRVEDLNQGPPDFKSCALNHSDITKNNEDLLTVILKFADRCSFSLKMGFGGISSVVFSP